MFLFSNVYKTIALAIVAIALYIVIARRSFEWALVILTLGFISASTSALVYHDQDSRLKTIDWKYRWTTQSYEKA